MVLTSVILRLHSCLSRTAQQCRSCFATQDARLPAAFVREGLCSRASKARGAAHFCVAGPAPMTSASFCPFRCQSSVCFLRVLKKDMYSEAIAIESFLIVSAIIKPCISPVTNTRLRGVVVRAI